MAIKLFSMFHRKFNKSVSSWRAKPLKCINKQTNNDGSRPYHLLLCTLLQTSLFVYLFVYLFAELIFYMNDWRNKTFSLENVGWWEKVGNQVVIDFIGRSSGILYCRWPRKLFLIYYLFSVLNDAISWLWFCRGLRKIEKTQKNMMEKWRNKLHLHLFIHKSYQNAQLDYHHLHDFHIATDC